MRHNTISLCFCDLFLFFPLFFFLLTLKYFRSDGIRPEWEDPANGQGGKWVASFARSQKSTLDRTWLYLILAVIGEQFRDSEEICGCVVSIRAQACRIAMWVRSADRNAFMSIGNQIKLILGLPPKKLEFTTHSAAMKKNSSKSSATAVI